MTLDEADSQIREKAAAEEALFLADKLRPDREKLLDFADLVQGLKVPNIQTTKAMAAVEEQLGWAAREIRMIADRHWW